MIMLHPDYQSGTPQEFRRTGQFIPLSERRCGCDVGPKVRDAYPREPLRAVTATRVTLLGRSAVVLLFIIAILLRALW